MEDRHYGLARSKAIFVRDEQEYNAQRTCVKTAFSVEF